MHLYGPYNQKMAITSQYWFQKKNMAPVHFGSEIESLKGLIQDQIYSCLLTS